MTNPDSRYLQELARAKARRASLPRCYRPVVTGPRPFCVTCGIEHDPPLHYDGEVVL